MGGGTPILPISHIFGIVHVLDVQFTEQCHRYRHTCGILIDWHDLQQCQRKDTHTYTIYPNVIFISNNSL